MDFDADGIDDVISGSYDPGDIWLFKGLGEGRYAKGAVLEDETGTALVHHPEELKRYHALREEKGENADDVLRDRVASFGSWPAPVDWDGDGDLDLLIGSFGGGIFLRVNEGTREAPRFAAASTDIGLEVPMHAAPVAADWDGDGRWDLVVGAGDGSVTFFANTGTATAPAFAEGRTLVARKSTSKFLRQYLAAGEAPLPGVRAQICVVDYDLDGRLDLLVGDYSDVVMLRDDLGDEERAEARRLTARHAELYGVAGAGQEEAKAVAKRLGELAVEREGRRTSHVWLYRRVAP